MIRRASPFRYSESIFWEIINDVFKPPASVAVAHMALNLTGPQFLDLQAYYVGLLKHTCWVYIA